MKKIVICLAVSLLCSPLFAQTFLKREFRGMWVATVANIDWPSNTNATIEKQQAELVVLFDKIASYGCNAVIFQVRPECDALYDSPFEPWSYWLTGWQGKAPSPFYDPLTFAIDEAHKRGMELHAWWNPYRAEKTIGNYLLSPNHVVNKHPDWILTFPTTKLRILNPGLQQVREYVTGIVADIVRRYNVDGVHADDYFYPYDPKISWQDTSTFRLNSRGFTDINDWRRDNVALLMKMVSDSLQAIKPNVKIGMSPFGIWKNGVPSGIIGMDNYNDLFADPVEWCRQKAVDYLSPQLYWKTGGSQDYAKLQPWWSSQMNGRHLYPGLAPYRIGTSTYGDAGMTSSQIRLNRSTGNTQGSILYTANSVTGNLGGFADSLMKDLYRYRALPPVCAWKELLPPNAPQHLRFAQVAGKPISQLMWDAAPPAADGDTANMFVVYRLDHGTVAQTDIDDARNIHLVTSLRSVTPLTSSLHKTMYFVVTSLDKNSNESGPSPVVSISVPAEVVLGAPVSGVVNQMQDLAVSWSSVGTASMYHLQVSWDSTFSAGFIVNDAALTDTVKRVSGLDGQQKYYWRVRALNAAGAGAFSESRTFNTGFPSTPVLALPANASPNHPFTGRLVWLRVPSALSYRIQVSVSADFTTCVMDTTGIADTSIVYENLAAMKIYFWRVTGTNQAGVSNWSEVWRFRTQAPTPVTIETEQPGKFALEQNYPNPFNPETNIQFSVKTPGRVRLDIYDVLGRLAATLIDRDMQPGNYIQRWNGANFPSGIYFYRLRSVSFTGMKRMLLQK